MRKRAVLCLAASVAIAMSGCTDASRQRTFSYGVKHTVEMYSGGVLVATWVTTGRPQSLGAEDGWQFVDAATGDLVIVTGDLVIKKGG